jgi:hypothetical protein
MTTMADLTICNNHGDKFQVLYGEPVQQCPVCELEAHLDDLDDLEPWVNFLNFLKHYFREQRQELEKLFERDRNRDVAPKQKG